MDEHSRLLASVREQLASIHYQVRCNAVGWVVRVGDEVAYVRGLPSVRYGELLERADGLTGMAFDICPDEVGVLFLDPAHHVAAGDEIWVTGRVASVPVGDELLGRVVNALGRPLDGGPSLHALAHWPVERDAPGVIERVPVRVPLHTGITVIDVLLPLGRGQRELLGDRGTGKTAIALDAILAQRDGDVLCVYAAIGQRKASVVDVVETLRAHGALPHTVVVADADSPPGLQYLAPSAACTIGEYFMRSGRHVLVVYDDLTRHADAYRCIALLLGRPPGREAYPADIFHLHARLLERATHLRPELGGGSLTALPLADTQLGNIAAYIPTNLISITDGQIYLDLRLFNEGLRPAGDVGLSVSRVGGKAQPPVLRQLAGDLKLAYAQLHELETFVRFGAELEPETRRRLARGRRLREVFKQRRLAPLRLGHQVAALLEALRQHLDEIESDQLDRSDREGTLDAAGEARLRAAIATVIGPLSSRGHGETLIVPRPPSPFPSGKGVRGLGWGKGARGLAHDP